MQHLGEALRGSRDGKRELHTQRQCTGNAIVNYCLGEPKEESSVGINIFPSDEKQTTKGMRNRFVTLRLSTHIQLPEMLNCTTQKGGIMPAVIFPYTESEPHEERKRY